MAEKRNLKTLIADIKALKEARDRQAKKIIEIKESEEAYAKRLIAQTK